VGSKQDLWPARSPNSNVATEVIQGVGQNFLEFSHNEYSVADVMHFY
jgi:hypothetical protein